MKKDKVLVNFLFNKMLTSVNSPNYNFLYSNLTSILLVKIYAKRGPKWKANKQSQFSFEHLFYAESNLLFIKKAEFDFVELFSLNLIMQMGIPLMTSRSWEDGVNNFVPTL